MWSSIHLPAQTAINDFIHRSGLVKPKIVVSGAAKNGDSYSGQVYRIVAVDETDASGEHNNNNGHSNDGNRQKEVHLIVKLPPDSVIRRSMYNTVKHFGREEYMFQTVLPYFLEFQQKHLKPNELFQNYPTFYQSHTSEPESEFVLLNDLHSLNYSNAERNVPLPYDKCVLVLTELAKFHAISFAIKDQFPEKFQQLTEPITEIMFIDPLSAGMESFLKKQVDYTVTTLNRQRDSEVLKRLLQFQERYGQAMVDACAEREDAIILHGDCWISNMMFNDNESDGKKIIFLDWQVSRYGTVAIDLSYFIFCCTDATIRTRFFDLLKIYHSTLMGRIKELGSDGERLFSYDKLLSHMKKHAMFGVGMAIMTLHAICMKPNELINVQEALEMSNVDDIVGPMINNPVYIKRMSDVLHDIVRFGYM